MADNTKKTRGRPKKEFISRKPKVKKDGPGRPKKIIKEEKKPEIIRPVSIPFKKDDEKKDRFILGMFVFSLIIFTVSLYFAQKKQELEISNTIGTGAEISINTGDIDTGATNTGMVDTGIVTNTGIIDESGAISDTTTNIDNTEPAESQIIKEFYNAFKNGTISTLSGNIDQKLRASRLFQVFFSKKWSQRFLNNLNVEGLKLGEITSDGKPNPTLTYTLSYALQNGQAFKENRQTSIVNTPTQKIAKMMCINTGCSKLPFFNPGKYNIH